MPTPNEKKIKPRVSRQRVTALCAQPAGGRLIAATETLGKVSDTVLHKHHSATIHELAKNRTWRVPGLGRVPIYRGSRYLATDTQLWAFLPSFSSSSHPPLLFPTSHKSYLACDTSVSQPTLQPTSLNQLHRNTVNIFFCNVLIRISSSSWQAASHLPSDAPSFKHHPSSPCSPIHAR